MGKISRECLGLWKGDIYNLRYSKVVSEVTDIAMIFYGENDKEWIETIEALKKEVEGLTKYRIMYNHKEYLKDFFDYAIKAVRGKCRVNELKQKSIDTIKLLESLYIS